jgi:hypothetical protein
MLQQVTFDICGNNSDYDLFWVCRQLQQLFILYPPLHITTCFGLSGHPQVKYTQSFLKAITPTMDPFLGHTAHYFQIMLCNIL